MLETSIQPHREYLNANMPQKMFIALKVRPLEEAANTRPELSVAFVIDTSGSMREAVTEPTGYTGQTVRVDGKEYELVSGAKSKMDLVIEALEPFTAATDRAKLVQAAKRLTEYSGGTHMGAGMEAGFKELLKEEGSRRMWLLTDGLAFDEELIKSVTDDLTQHRIPVTVIGVGDEWNEDLIGIITDKTQGKPFHMVADNQDPQPPSLRASELPQAILGELQQAGTEVVTNIGLTVKTVRDVVLERITRVYPTQTEVDLKTLPHPLGNAAKEEWTVFILEFTLPARPPSRIRLAQLGLTYEVPGKGYRGEMPPIDLLAEFTTDEALSGQIDPQVMQWVQQRNIELLVKQAAMEARNDPEKATKTLELARNMTIKLGNSAMTQALDRAVGELKTNKTLQIGTAKTLKIGAKTQVLKEGTSTELPSDEEIRKITGS
jgi:Ca-activated chloride channel homolog